MTACASITLVRHGETVGESSIRYHGANDVALSELGRNQMQRVGNALAQERFDLVLTSTLQRSTEAAQLIAPAATKRALRGFDEVDFGAWEGLTAAEIEARDPQRFRAWRADFTAFTYPDGDSVRGFRERVAATMAAELPQLPDRTLIVVHKGVIASIVAFLLGRDLGERMGGPIDLGSIHVLERSAEGWRLICECATALLDGR